MFIGPRAKRKSQLRSEERNPNRVSPLQNQSAPQNGAGGCCSSRYKHATSNEVKTVNCYSPNVRALAEKPSSITDE